MPQIITKTTVKLHPSRQCLAISDLGDMCRDMSRADLLLFLSSMKIIARCLLLMSNCNVIMLFAVRLCKILYINVKGVFYREGKLRSRWTNRHAFLYVCRVWYKEGL